MLNWRTLDLRASSPIYLRSVVLRDIVLQKSRQKSYGDKGSRSEEVQVSKQSIGPFTMAIRLIFWTLGRILMELLDDIPKETSFRGKMMVVNKQPAMQLAQHMLSPSPKDRPDASACLQHAWLIEDNTSVCKRDRSPTPGTAVVMSSKRVLRTTSSTTPGQGSTQILMDVMFPEDRNSGTGKEDRTASASIVSPGNNDTIPWTIDSSDTSTRRLAASIERELARTRSLDLQPLPAIHVDQTDVTMSDVPPESMEILDRGRSSDCSGANHGNSDSDSGRGVTYPSEYDGGVTAGMSHINGILR